MRKPNGVDTGTESIVPYCGNSSSSCADTAVIARGALHAAAPNSGVAGSLEAEPIKVFLVDDHRAILWGLERLVESAAPKMVVVGTAANRADMFDRLPGAQADVIVLDLDLGGESGLDYLEKLYQETPAKVLVYTGSTDPALHQQAVIRGARGVVHKQVDGEVVLRAIDKVHRGEVWLDAVALASVLTSLSRGSKTEAEVDHLAVLTRRERQIVEVLMQEKGAPNKIIADKLCMSEHTLRNSLTTIYSKLGVKGRMELYCYAVSNQAPTRRRTDAILAAISPT